MASPMVWAQAYSDYGTGYPDDYSCWDRIDLSPEQEKKIDKLQQEFYAGIDSLQADLEARYRELDELERNPAAARGSFDKTWDRIYEIQDRLDEKWAEHNQKIRNVLTPEQRQRLDDFGYGYGPGFIGTTGYGRGGGGYYGRGGNYYRRGRGFLRGGRGMGMRQAVPRGNRFYPNARGYDRGTGHYNRYAGPGRGMGRNWSPGYGRGYQRDYGYYNYGRGPCGRGLGKGYNSRNGRGYGWRK